MSEIRMPFGKYKGWLLNHIDSDYLFWVLENTSPSPGLEMDIRAELQSRQARALTATALVIVAGMHA